MPTQTGPTKRVSQAVAAAVRSPQTWPSSRRARWIVASGPFPERHQLADELADLSFVGPVVDAAADRERGPLIGGDGPPQQPPAGADVGRFLPQLRQLAGGAERDAAQAPVRRAVDPLEADEAVLIVGDDPLGIALLLRVVQADEQDLRLEPAEGVDQLAEAKIESECGSVRRNSSASSTSSAGSPRRTTWTPRAAQKRSCSCTGSRPHTVCWSRSGGARRSRVGGGDHRRHGVASVPACGRAGVTGWGGRGMLAVSVAVGRRAVGCGPAGLAVGRSAGGAKGGDRRAERAEARRGGGGRR